MRGIAWFLGLSFGLAWISWEIAIRSGVDVLSWQFQLYALPGAFAPAIAAIIVRKWITREGFADAGLRLNRKAWRYYLMAWLLPLLIVGAITLQAQIFGVAEPDFGLVRATPPAQPGAAGLHPNAWLVVPQLLATALLMTPVLWGEEFGWRGYLQQRISPDRPLRAALITGVIWALWHFPLTMRGFNYPDHPVLGSLFLFIPFTILNSYIFGWLMRKTGSIWTPSLAHSATNTIGALALLWLNGAAGPALIGYGGVFAVLPLLIVCVCLYRLDDKGSEVPPRAALSEA